MSDRDPHWKQRRPWPQSAAASAAVDWNVVVYVAGEVGPASDGLEASVAGFWTAVRGRLGDRGLGLDVIDGNGESAATDSEGSAYPHLEPVPRPAPNGLRPVRVRLRTLRPTADGASGSSPPPDAPATQLGFVIGPESSTGNAAEAVAQAFEGLGYPCLRAPSIAHAAEAFVDRLGAEIDRVVGLPGGNDHTPAPLGGSSRGDSPWRPVLLMPLVGLLVLHSINPWLRGDVKTRFQLPGFSYDFLNFESVPLVAPLVVGLPTLVTYWVIGRLWRWTQVAPPWWARLALLIPAVTTVYFAARFFVEGRIVSTHSQVVHSEGLGMLVETIGMFEPVDDDHFRYMQPGSVNYSHTILPFWEPWAILIVALAVLVLSVNSLYRLRIKTEP